jgi:acyl-CoA thioesterase
MDPANDEEALTRVERLHAVDTAARELGIALTSAGAGAAEVSMTVGEQHLGSLGQLHGGVLFTLADVAMSYAGNSRGNPSMAIRAAIDFVDAAALGDVLVAQAVEHSLRGKAGIYDVEIRTAADARLIATFRGNTLRVS